MATVIYEKHGEIAYITLNRPEVHNAIDTETDELLFATWTHFRDDPDVRIAILTGAGDQTFCAGADLTSHVDPWLNAGPELGRSLLEKGFAGRITRGLHRMPKPIIERRDQDRATTRSERTE
jgi:enoyl-CoA hydratase